MIPKLHMHKVHPLICGAVGTSPNTVERVWRNAIRFNSWNLDLFMINPPSKTTIRRVRRVITICVTSKGAKKGV